MTRLIAARLRRPFARATERRLNRRPSVLTELGRALGCGR